MGSAGAAHENIYKMGGYFMRKLAPLGNVIKWVARPLGRALRFGISVTGKLMRRSPESGDAR